MFQCFLFKTADGRPDGTIEIQIMASNPDAQDSFNCNFAIADEVAAYKKPSQYLLPRTTLLSPRLRTET